MPIAGNGLYTADFDSDGKIDILVPIDANFNFAVARNTSTPGNLSFVTTASLGPNLRGPISIADMDGDGKPDIIALSVGNNTDKISVIRNLSSTGSMSFSPEVDFQTADYPTSLAIADLDGDGKPDVTVTCSVESKISIYKSLSTTGNIVLCSPVDMPMASAPSAINLVDIDGDGKLDMSFNSPGVTTYLNNMQPAPLVTLFTPTKGITGTAVTITGQNFSGVTAVNIGGTRAQSFVVNNAQSITAIVGTGSSGPVSVTNAYDSSSLPGFSFGQAPVISSFSPLMGPAGTSVTITGDHFDPLPANNIVFFGKVAASVTSASATRLVVTAPPMATYQPITVTSNHLVGYSAVPYRLTFAGGDTTFNARTFSIPVSLKSFGGIAVGDIDGDGKMDIIMSDNNSGKLIVKRNAGMADSLLFVDQTLVSSGISTSFLNLVDIDNDGKLDLVCVNSSPSTITIYRNTGTVGNISFAPALNLSSALTAQNFIGISGIAFADMDNDGKTDIVTINYSTYTATVYHNETAGSTIAFGQRVDYLVNGYPTSLDLTDIDGDGKADMIVGATGGTAGGIITVFRNSSLTGSIAFSTQTNLTPGDSYGYFATGDLDGDGKPDIIANKLIFRNESSAGGTIAFTSTSTSANPILGTGAVGDLNGDGNPDYVDNSSGSLGIHKNSSTTGHMLFNKADDYYIKDLGAISYRSMIADVDNDGKPDIVQNTNSGIYIIRNKTKKILSLPYNNFNIQFTGSSCRGSNNGSIAIAALTNLPYTATITGNAYNSVTAFNTNLTVSNLLPGTYNVCITVAGYPDYQQCFTAAITEPKSLSTFTVVDPTLKTVNIQLSGSDSYTINLNGIVYQTNQSSITLALQKGNNELLVTTPKSCQGEYKQRIVMDKNILVYPNPFENSVYIDLGTSVAPTGKVQVTDAFGKTMINRTAPNNNGKMFLDMSSLKSGVYFIVLSIDDTQSVFKVLKK